MGASWFNRQIHVGTGKITAYAEYTDRRRTHLSQAITSVVSVEERPMALPLTRPGVWNYVTELYGSSQLNFG